MFDAAEYRSFLVILRVEQYFNFITTSAENAAIYNYIVCNGRIMFRTI